MKKERLDRLLVQRGFCESREKARALIMSGAVWVDGRRVDKAGTRVPVEAGIEIRGRGLPYVSRGGLKLEGALRVFGLSVKGFVCADLGASTGGFTDCLLRHGAARVYAVDVGRGQLHERLRRDPRVISLEGVNARYLSPGDLPERMDLVTIDVSFISLRKVLPAAVRILKPGGFILALVKPQFEVGPREVGRGGVVRDHAKHRRVVEEIWRFGEDELGLKALGVAESPVPGPAGNREFFILFDNSPLQGSKGLVFCQEKSQEEVGGEDRV
ncbi:TlyA family RNA methyltransferase [Thermosulfurimonas sp. F29]|uniref:TlyA family RNA methyltransferase n=1 Tax=Thermosulfurimonas sp. F29 TaxID=2867247 RepID=UPI001C8340B1|nr:TlyA family RNA methyltransferase [Thermosulfurimonas sp. F29]MBX6422254.1 TlyA family RNA methyltransferase [Thermosulfurimonas sp. F29]